MVVYCGHINLGRLPDSCPACDKKIQPILTDTHVFAERTKTLQVVCRCPNNACESLFIAVFRPAGEWWYPVHAHILMYHEETEFDERISGISPDFCVIYQQAEAAEAGGLSKICGTGYRKALEFLIRDFVVKFTLAEEADPKKDEAKRMPLVGCIRTYITSEKIRFVAERAAWLGNDQTHYTQLWEGKDLSDLKRLVDMTVNYICLELDAAEYMKDMPQGKRT